MRTAKTLAILLLFSVKMFAQLIPSFVDDAVLVGDDCYKITSATNNQSGAVWYNNAIDLNDDFDIIFDADFGSNDANGADGLAFVMKTTPLPTIGASGGGVGYEGILSSLIVEFDTYQNGNRADPYGDHVALLKNGVSNHASTSNLDGPVNASATSVNIEDGNTHEVKIQWRATTQTFKVFFDCAERISYTGDLINVAFNGASSVYFGFTGSTGGYYNLQQICFKYISFLNDVNIYDQQICYGETIDNVDVSYSNATFQWSPISGVSDPTSPTPTFSPDSDTTYTVTITDNCGEVILTNSFDVTVIPESLANVNYVSSSVCPGGNAEFEITGTPNTIVTYHLNGGANQSVSLGDLGVASIIIPSITEDQTLTVVSSETNFDLISGNAISANGGEFNANALGAILTVGSSANNTNSAQISSADQTMVLTLEDAVPEGTTITLSVSPNSNASVMTVSDGVNVQTINSGTPNTIQYISYTTAQQTNTLTFTSSNLGYWIDGVEYTYQPSNCFTEINESVTVTLLANDDASFTLSPTCDGAMAEAVTPGGTYSMTSMTGPGTIDAVTGTITGGNPGDVYTVEYTTNGDCPSTTAETVIVHQQPTINNPNPTLAVCDDNIADGLTSIDLTLVSADISGSVPGYSVSYYYSQTDADNNLNPLSIPYTNISNPQTIYARLENEATGCYATTLVELSVQQAPGANIPAPYEVCDPDADCFSEFDLASLDGEITGGDTTLVVTYHETMDDALFGVNAIDTNVPYNNIVACQQTLYANVESMAIATDCPTIIEVQLIVHPEPQIMDPSPLEVCDDASDDGIAQFNLNLKEGEILNGLDPMDYLIGFYETEANAITGTNPIVLPGNYTNTVAYAQTVWVNVVDIASGCTSVTSLELIVNQLPVLAQPTPLSLCDENNPGDQMEE
uniref:L-type lectin-domain containing protein n=1 Tax=Mangrovimonas aestuarii TaxID=3018443 RepID=UPI002378745B